MSCSKNPRTAAFLLLSLARCHIPAQAKTKYFAYQGRLIDVENGANGSYDLPCKVALGNQDELRFPVRLPELGQTLENLVRKPNSIC